MFGVAVHMAGLEWAKEVETGRLGCLKGSVTAHETQQLNGTLVSRGVRGMDAAVVAMVDVELKRVSGSEALHLFVVSLRLGLGLRMEEFALGGDYD